MDEVDTALKSMDDRDIYTVRAHFISVFSCFPFAGDERRVEK